VYITEVDKYISFDKASIRLGPFHHHSRKNSDYRQQYPLLASVRDTGHLHIHNRAKTPSE